MTTATAEPDAIDTADTDLAAAQDAALEARERLEQAQAAIAEYGRELDDISARVREAHATGADVSELRRRRREVVAQRADLELELPDIRAVVDQRERAVREATVALYRARRDIHRTEAEALGNEIRDEIMALVDAMDRLEVLAAEDRNDRNIIRQNSGTSEHPGALYVAGMDGSGSRLWTLLRDTRDEWDNYQRKVTR